MAHQNVCQFFKYGYCKFKIACRKQHILEKCKKQNCENGTCNQRHPRICRYLRDNGYCKFSEYCLFEHDFVKSDVQEIKDITVKLKGIEELIAEKSKDIETLEKVIKEKAQPLDLDEIERKFETYEKNLESLKTCLLGKDLFISTLEETIKNDKMRFNKFEKEQNHKIETLENANEENTKKINYLMETLSKTGNRQPKNADLHKCTKCEFESQSEKGLNTHITRKHTEASTLKFPKKCDLCEKEYGNSTELRKHLRTHSYKEAKFQCEDCDFVGKSRETMNVHVGRSHTDQFECGLCDTKFENSPLLETHLNTCEMFRCRMCWQERTTISEIKEHLQKKHKGPQPIIIEHFKMSRHNNYEVTSKDHWAKEL